MIVTEDLARDGKVLFGREQGAQIVRRVEEHLSSLKNGGFVILRLDGLDAIDYAAADEIAKGIMTLVWAGTLRPEHHVVYMGGQDNVVEAFVAANRARSVVGFHFTDMASLRNGQWRILGNLPGHLIDTLRALHRGGPSTAESLAKHLGITVGAAQNRLTELRRRGLATRKVGNSRGKYIYEFHCSQRCVIQELIPHNGDEVVLS
ncbi:MAG: hypothetical protein ACUVX1_13135 [Chloroflexota bacterium]